MARMVVKIVGLFLICAAVAAAYVAWDIGTSPPVDMNDAMIATNGTHLFAIGSAALFIGGMMALLRR